MSFIEVRFPEDISYGSSGGPEYATGVVMAVSGHEKRNINWLDARARYNVAHGVKTREQLDALIAFFRARKGRAYGFRFKDWSDFKAAGELIGTGNGVNQQFQLVKRYSSGGAAEVRAIMKPVAGTAKIYLNSVEQLSGWALDTTTGIVAFESPPGNMVQVHADFEFDVPVRFDTDRLSTLLESYGIFSVLDIPLVEVRI